MTPVPRSSALTTCGMYGHPIDLVPDFKVLYWGPQVVWGFITIPYLCHALLLYLNCSRYCTLYYLGKRSVFAVSTSPVLGSQSFTATGANPESVSETGRLRCG